MVPDLEMHPAIKINPEKSSNEMKKPIIISPKDPAFTKISIR